MCPIRGTGKEKVASKSAKSPVTKCLHFHLFMVLKVGHVWFADELKSTNVTHNANFTNIFLKQALLIVCRYLADDCLILFFILHIVKSLDFVLKVRLITQTERKPSKSHKDKQEWSFSHENMI